jgi:hypothetical protein
MRPLIDADLSQVRAVFTDVDGTLTTGGKLHSAALKAIEWLQAHGVPVVLVSGRSAGWGECWARQWPVAGAIVENGGLYFAWREGRLVKVYAEPPAERIRNRLLLRTHVDDALAEVEGTRLSLDSLYTEVDLAIDYAEDAQLDEAAADELEAFLTSRKVTAVRSSVHVNCWLGSFDKLRAVRSFLKTEWNERLEKADERYVYVGDSFNDASMFKAFPLSVGVANVRDILDRLEHQPAFVTRGREGKGFGEVADSIAKSRRRVRKGSGS